jgi:hypothetical protein
MEIWASISHLISQGPVATPPPGVDVDTIIGALAPLALGVVGLIVAGAVLYRFFGSDLAAAIAERIRAGIHRRRPSPETPAGGIEGAAVVELQHNVIEMRGQIAEMAERLDFAERLLAAQKRERSLPGA